MRIDYSDDEDYSGQFALWNANLNRHLMGKKGQVALSELREALLALPSKRLIAKSLAMDGEVCAIGALIASRHSEEERSDVLAKLQMISEDGEDSAEYAASLGIPKLTAWGVVAENDLSLQNYAPEERYQKMLKWVEDRLNGIQPRNY